MLVPRSGGGFSLGKVLKVGVIQPKAKCYLDPCKTHVRSASVPR